MRFRRCRRSMRISSSSIGVAVHLGDVGGRSVPCSCKIQRVPAGPLPARHSPSPTCTVMRVAKSPGHCEASIVIALLATLGWGARPAHAMASDQLVRRRRSTAHGFCSAPAVSATSLGTWYLGRGDPPVAKTRLRLTPLGPRSRPRPRARGLFYGCRPVEHGGDGPTTAPSTVPTRFPV